MNDFYILLSGFNTILTLIMRTLFPIRIMWGNVHANEKVSLGERGREAGARKPMLVLFASLLSRLLVLSLLSPSTFQKLS